MKRKYAICDENNKKVIDLIFTDKEIWELLQSYKILGYSRPGYNYNDNDEGLKWYRENGYS